MDLLAKFGEISSFPEGYESFHTDQLYNFQLNRWYSLGYGRREDLIRAGSRIKSFSDWQVELTREAELAESEGRVLQSTYYFRAAEFYVPPGNSLKGELYQRFLSRYEALVKGLPLENFLVPYNDGFLPCIRLKGSIAPVNGTILIHGGFDSFKEEFLSMAIWFFKNGYDVIVFDGPGQGQALRQYGITFDYRWEKPVKAILDFFDLQGVTLLGISLGGYLCLRAASRLEGSRVQRVIANSTAYDHMQIPPLLLRPIIKLFYFKFRNFTNRASWKAMQKDGLKSWYLSNLMYMTGQQEPMDAIDIVSSMTSDKLHCEDITQDVLILNSQRDHMVPIRMHRKQMGALNRARSLEGIVFTERQSAANHCQVGNIGLSLRTMDRWIREKRES